MNTKLQVLVIDDDAVVGRSFDRVLSGKGYEVSTALSGEEAMDTIKDTDFDVVFTDIKMPGMDGLEVAEQIKASASNMIDKLQPLFNHMSERVDKLATSGAGMRSELATTDGHQQLLQPTLCGGSTARQSREMSCIDFWKVAAEVRCRLPHHLGTPLMISDRGPSPAEVLLQRILLRHWQRQFLAEPYN